MKLGRRGTMAMEFALTAPVLFLLMFSGIEFARLLWSWQAIQIAGDQTARCVAIAGTACTTPATYAVNMAHSFGAVAVTASNVTIVNSPLLVTNATACSPPGGNTAVLVTISFTFTSAFSALIPALNRTLATTSCYPLSGK